MSDIQSISQGNYILQGTVATSAGIVGDGTTQNPLRADETVLWEGTANTTATSGTLSESLENFNMAKIYTVGTTTDRASIITTVEPRFGTSNYTLMYFPNYSIGGGTTTENTMYLQVFSNKTFKLLAGSKWVNGTFTQSITAYDFSIKKIVGINRKNNA